MDTFRTLLLLLFLTPSLAAAQGFNTFNGRNHPELKWRVAETEHFKIMYPEHLAGIEVEAAPIAEETYAALSKNLGVSFEHKIPIYLSDEDEILNGFATPLGRTGYTDIWVHINEVAANWTGPDKWLRQVMAHELAHIFHYRAVRSNMRPLDLFLGDPLPRFWVEGFAQYETEVWSSYRGDQWLRTAVLDDRLSYKDGRSLWNGRLEYAVGNSQLRYFAQTYGDTTLAKVLAHRNKAFFGLGRYHDFEDAFEEVVDKSYNTFYDEWRRHVNIYYNTLAGQMENADSLDVDPLKVPGQYLYDVQFSPDTSHVAILAVTSLRRPVRRLYVMDLKEDKTEIVAEGAIRAPISWSPDGRRLAFARQERGRHGSLLNDLFVVDADGKNLERITHSRRAIAPTFSPAGDQLAFIASEGPTANLFVMDIRSRNEGQVTSFTGDMQLASARWHPTEPRIAFARFTPEGKRDIVEYNLASNTLTPITNGEQEDLGPVWSPDGLQVAYTSMRDNVPNVFVFDRQTGQHARATHIVNGATVHDWLPADSAFASGSFAVSGSASKQRDRAYRIDASRRITHDQTSVPLAFEVWTTHRPPNEVASIIPPNEALITSRSKYRSLGNLKHAFSFVFPFYGSSEDWGISGFTSWTEPLGKHTLALTGGVSIPDPVENSFIYVAYQNNQLKPTLSFTGYTLLPSVKAYGDSFIYEDQTGGSLLVSWPIDWFSRPYTGTTLGVDLAYLRRDPFEDDASDSRQLIPPVKGHEAQVGISITRKRQRPYADNLIHPLDGHGWRLRLAAGLPVLEANTDYVRAEAAAYAILPGGGNNRIFLYGSGRAQGGDVLPQDRLGFSRHDDFQLVAPALGLVSFVDTDRVRGYQDFVLGNRVLFGSAEYRIPLLPSLQTQVLGIVSFGATTFSAFADAGIVWNDDQRLAERLGLGGEIKNLINIGGIQFLHAVGVAQPHEELGNWDEVEVYYRLRATVPF